MQNDAWDEELKSLRLEYSDRADLVLIKNRKTQMVWDWYVREVDIIRKKYVK